MTTALGLGLIGMGIMLLWSAITGQGLVDELKATFTS